MGIPTLIGSAHTASNASNVAITSGINSTYDEYMFVFTDINPATDGVQFTLQCSIDGGSNYNVTLTSTYFYSYHIEDDSNALKEYDANRDLAQSTSYHQIMSDVGNGSDECATGILHLFNPSNTTYVKHFYSTVSSHLSGSGARGIYTAGYFNTTSAINAINFKMSSGNFDGVVQMFGIE